MIRLLIFYTLLHFSCLIFGQQPGTKIIAVTDKHFYSVIPSSVFRDSSIIGIVSPDRTGSSQEFNAYWNSVCNDGSFNLTITPEQIYFTSHHDNPNPNRLYWVIPIKNSVYSAVIKGFRKMNLKKSYFDAAYNDSELLPENWTDSSSLLFDNNCKRTTELQLDKMFRLLNTFVTDSGSRIDKSKRMILKNPVYFGPDKKQIQSWMPKKASKIIGKIE